MSTIQLHSMGKRLIISFPSTKHGVFLFSFNFFEQYWVSVSFVRDFKMLLADYYCANHHSSFCADYHSRFCWVTIQGFAGLPFKVLRRLPFKVLLGYHSRFFFQSQTHVIARLKTEWNSPERGLVLSFLDF